MQWIILILVAVSAYRIIRYFDNKSESVPSQAVEPVETQPAASREPPDYASRTPMPFEDFYQRYYAEDHIDPEFVRSILKFLEKTGGVYSELIRPEDRVEFLPKPEAHKGIQFVEEMLDAGLRRHAQEEGIPPVEFHLETVDSLIRQLEPAHLDVFKTHSLLGE